MAGIQNYQMGLFERREIIMGYGYDKYHSFAVISIIIVAMSYNELIMVEYI